jgi:hypothetical protein
MRELNLNQTGFALAKSKSRQAVNPCFTGRKSLLTDTGKGLLEYLGVRIRLEIVRNDEKAN